MVALGQPFTRYEQEAAGRRRLGLLVTGPGGGLGPLPSAAKAAAPLPTTVDSG